MEENNGFFAGADSVNNKIILAASAHKDKLGISMIPLSRIANKPCKMEQITTEPTWDVCIKDEIAYSVVRRKDISEIIVSRVNESTWEYGIQRLEIPENYKKIRCMSNYLIIDYVPPKHFNGAGLQPLVYKINNDGLLEKAGLQLPYGKTYGIKDNYLFLSEGDEFYIADINNPEVKKSIFKTGYGINKFTFLEDKIIVSTDGGAFIYK